MKRILLTGSNGFIGKNLKQSFSSKDVLYELNENFYKDIDWKFKLNEDLLITQPNVIFHVGACSDTLEQDVNYMMLRNFESTKILTDYSKQFNIPLIYSSSAASYGTDGLNPSNLYGWSKYVAEQYVISNGGIGLRYFNVYGPGEEHKGKMASMIFQIIEKQKNSEEIKLFPKKPKRDFVYVKDIVNANLYAYENYDKLKSNYYDVGTGVERSFEDILNCLKIQDFSYYKETDIPKGYQFHTKADGNKFMFGWKPKYDLEDGIMDYLKYIIPYHSVI
jgi:ADP-L-glycero-D-manno-heptose 6-epimerase